jgi:thiamine-phosphate pyrophosphorylase
MENSGFERSDPAAGAWRAADAAANRAGEALRVIEDVVRFILDDAELTRRVKQLRHDLSAVLAGDDLPQRVFLRDTPGDVGAGVEAAAALPRCDARDLVVANAARAAQALRSLQECALLLVPAVAMQFEQLRYRLFAIERAAVGTIRAADRFQGIRLCVLVDGGRDLPAFTRLIESLLEAGVRMVQIRDKHLGVPALVDRARQAIAVARRRAPEGGAIIVVNDRADVAAAVGADGVHTGADDLPTVLARRVIGPRRILGRTAHDLAEAQAAVIDGADYLGVGPCFPSVTKSFESFAAAEFIGAVAREISLPAFAIGGVTLERIEALALLGVRRVAVASAVTNASDPAAAAAALNERLNRLSERDQPTP